MRKRNIIKRTGILFSMLLLMGILSGCGNNATEERIKTGEERAIELKGEAEEVVDQMNDKTNNLMQDADTIDQQ